MSLRNPMLRRHLAALGLVVLATGVAAQPARIPAEVFFDNPAMSAAKLSPNARHVAITMTRKGGLRSQLVVMDTEKLTAKVIAAPGDSDIRRVEWVNDDRLVFTMADSQAAQADTFLGQGLFGVQRDGTGYFEIVSRRPGLAARSFLIGTTWDRKSNDVFVGSPRHGAINLTRVNTIDGRTWSFLPRPSGASEWLVDPRDQPRVILSHVDGHSMLHSRAADGTWLDVVGFPTYSTGAMDPVEVGADDSLYVVTRGNRDTSALYRFDLARKALDPEPVVSVQGFDFEGALVRNQQGIVGVRYRGEAWGTVWLDPTLQAVQATVDALLPGTANLLGIPHRPEVPLVLVRAFSDADPGTFLLFNTQTSQLTELGRAMRDVEPRQMAQRDLVRFQARDGLVIPAWLTLPPGGKGRRHPLVVLVHGGPFIRGGDWQWDAESQFLASRGYAVLEPEFRGSAGYGHKHLKAGFKQWGLAMQHDLVDGVRWAVAQGHAEPGRVCIAGGSYGGYATLVGLIEDADVYSCGISWGGVSDLDLMYSATWSDLSATWKAHGMPILIGDRDQDADKLKAASPLHQAARLKKPLFMAHGGADRRVPIAHGVRFRDAARRAGAQVEWVEYLEEGHGWYLVKNRVDFWTRVENFLQRHIGAK